MSEQYQVYILQNPNGKRYIGISEDPVHRLEQHNQGDSRWTAKHGPWKLEWTSRTMNLSQARKLENQMKRQKGGAGLKKLLTIYGS